jgi:uncharacterized glyoxalase superfamily protein PhnB
MEVPAMTADARTDIPAPTIFPSVGYRDQNAAIEFLTRAFGFEEHVIYRNADGSVAHAELRYGPSIMFVSTADPGRGHLYVAVDDADAHCERARAAGATIDKEPYDTDYGSRDYRARDPEGNAWSFGTYRPGADD